jgi:hypothetical protein
VDLLHRPRGAWLLKSLREVEATVACSGTTAAPVRHACVTPRGEVRLPHCLLVTKEVGALCVRRVVQMRDTAPTQVELLRSPVLGTAIKHLAQYSEFTGSVADRASGLLNAFYPLDLNDLPAPTGLSHLHLQVRRPLHMRRRVSWKGRRTIDVQLCPTGCCALPSISPSYLAGCGAGCLLP